jgi:hypothetical protein
LLISQFWIIRLKANVCNKKTEPNEKPFAPYGSNV